MNHAKHNNRAMIIEAYNAYAEKLMGKFEENEPEALAKENPDLFQFILSGFQAATHADEELLSFVRLIKERIEAEPTELEYYKPLMDEVHKRCESMLDFGNLLTQYAELETPSTDAYMMLGMTAQAWAQSIKASEQSIGEEIQKLMKDNNDYIDLMNKTH